MSGLDLAGYVADAAVIVTYLWLVRTGHQRAFNWANAFGGIPILIGECLVGAYVPMILTGFFTSIGWYGISRGAAA